MDERTMTVEEREKAIAEITGAPVEQKTEFSGQEVPQNTPNEMLEMYRSANEWKNASEVKTYKTILGVMCAVVALLAVAVVIVSAGWITEQGIVVTQIETVEIPTVVTEYIAIDPTSEYDHELGEDTFTLSDSNYGTILMYALQNVGKNEYDEECFTLDKETGYITYDDGETYSIMGIDVSVYQGDIDWDAVKEAGVEFAIIRCGYRGYVTGTVNEDANFRANIKGATDAGIKVGVYFFSQALTVEEALEEAEFCLDLVDGYELDYPIFFDWEVVIDADGDTARTAYIDPQQLTDNFLTFAQRVEIDGYTAGIYANKKTAVWKYDLSRVDDYMMWFAGYSETPTLYYDLQMWQYSSSGTVDGISGSVDLNIAFVTR
ncbi:MAG: glycoside hydrolase family 25 protein [Oscillospiraceae bacterium]|nr:glycoside hydrolase family 25 protein [Oscillospiraceae bacterium]